jgi:hypothetical protein
VVFQSGRALLILAACVACVAKLHAGGGQPVYATQEVNRCLSVVRAAARRGSPVSAAGRREQIPIGEPRPRPSSHHART